MLRKVLWKVSFGGPVLGTHRAFLSHPIKNRTFPWLVTSSADVLSVIFFRDLTHKRNKIFQQPKQLNRFQKFKLSNSFHQIVLFQIERAKLNGQHDQWCTNFATPERRGGIDWFFGEFKVGGSSRFKNFHRRCFRLCFVDFLFTNV